MGCSCGCATCSRLEQDQMEAVCQTHITSHPDTENRLLWFSLDTYSSFVCLGDGGDVWLQFVDMNENEKEF